MPSMRNPPSSSRRPFERLGHRAIRFGHALKAADDALFAWLCRASDKGLERGLGRINLAFALLGLALVGVAFVAGWLAPDTGRHRGRVVGLSTAAPAGRIDHRCARGDSPESHIVVVAFDDGGDPRAFDVPDEPRWGIGDEAVAKLDSCVLERPPLLGRR